MCCDTVTICKPRSERDISEKFRNTWHFGVLQNVNFVKMIVSFQEFLRFLKENMR